MEKQEEDQPTEEQRKRAEANRAAALAKRKAILSQTEQNQNCKLLKCRKLSPNANFPAEEQPCTSDSNGPCQRPEKIRARLEICSPDSFSVTPVAVEGFVFPGEDVCFEKLRDCLLNVVLSHYTQNTCGGKACVYKLYDYHSVLKSLKNCKDIECEEIPWGTFNVVERFSHSSISGRWMPCRPEHLPDEKVDELISELPKTLLNALLPFQLDGVRFGLRRGGRCLIADEMGLGKTLQAIAIAACFMKEGSILVVCPAILRYSWAEELERWFPFCLPSDVHLVFGGPDNPARLAKRPRVVVVSYTMLRRLRSSMLEQDWATLIVDESHHLHCNKKTSEKDELKVVLDVATKVKHLILLSGTPSLSRPFDIFHQVNMLWPGLLGQTKYEFAKTYCSVKFIKSSQGKVFQDFSKGTRLEELNVLLKESIMIRRLKEHVLLQLPPKRRQIITLVLSKSDIDSAMVALGLEDVDATAESDAENAPVHVSDENQDCDITDMNKKLSKKLSALGLAKLPGFFEWLSIHPIMVEMDGEETRQESSSSHKMIIFAYHHKVLDGVQAFLCEKGVQFVRIDCTITGVDRHSAIQSFQSSKEVKIALIGIRAGSSGLNLTSADTVVFLELPMNPADIQQAEDRAHRHGQKRQVNVYIFCAKDTSDELQWQQLNRSLHRVSSTVNGKRHIIREIEVEGVSYLESARSTSEKSEESMRFQNSRVEHEPKLPKASFDMHVTVDKGCDEHEGEKTLNEDGCVSKVEYRVKTDVQPTTLRFEVSQHTGRIHLYSCTSGTNCRPSPLFKSFRQEEVECRSLAEEHEKSNGQLVEDNSLYMEALMSFIHEWKELRPIERRRLINKPLQLPLSCELCYLNESLNYETGGLLRGGSSRRKTPLTEICNSLPSNAAWRTVSLCGGHDQKKKIYTQAWSDMDEPLCKLCQTPCKGNDAKVPQFFEDLFCSLNCFEEYRSRTGNRFLREGLFQIERGICTNCQLNCHRLVKHLRVLSLEKREAYIKKLAPNIAKRNKMLAKLVQDPTEGNAWHADHIVPVYKGGGECRLENMRTLCIACHAAVTTAQCAERRIARKKAKKQLKETMSGLINSEKFREIVLKKSDLEAKTNILDDDDLLIEIPGSAYSGPNVNRSNEQNQQPEVLGQSSSEHICSGSDDAPRVVDHDKNCQELEKPYDPVESDYSGEKSGVVTVERGGAVVKSDESLSSAQVMP
ncbi:SNF2 domain-containing protein / helicase domain-containing protein / HNH endonuclease domain-containing protein [Perilla frutescens var. hirtella]|nr:SNF2 domain-containing protein / helicase domain-containing protein / HNH endonuclease domain-containing protein [Perilla frutescens var. hirtella]